MQLPSPDASCTGLSFEDLDVLHGRSPRQKKSPSKRSRSGRLASPDKSMPRSKSPRLQRGFAAAPQNVGGEHVKLDEIRDAMRDMLTDM